MTFQPERIGDAEEALQLAMEGNQQELWTALPGIIEAIDFSNMTCTVQPTIQVKHLTPGGTWVYGAFPLLLQVPIHFPCGGGFFITFPIAKGDEVLVIFASRCIDAWWQQGGVQIPPAYRLHDVADGFALPGIRSVPNVPPNINQNTCQLRTQDGSAYIELTKTGGINIVAPGGLVVNGNAVFQGPIEAEAGLELGSGASITGDGGTVAIAGSVVATGEGNFRGIDVSVHVHGGVQTGGGVTGEPVG